RTCSTVGSGVFPPRRESADSDSGPGGVCRRLTGIAEPGPGTGSGGCGLSAFATQEPVDQPSDGPGHGTDERAGDEAGPRGEEAHYRVRQPGTEARESPAEAVRGAGELCGPADLARSGQENPF